MKKKELIARALKNRNKAYAPYSKFFVGAALLTADGEIFDGANVENASYGLTICAERVAATNAVVSGKKIFKAIAIACGGGDYCRPCGACRQFLAEFSPDMEIIMVNDKGEAQVMLLSQLLPSNFSNTSFEGGPNGI